MNAVGTADTNLLPHIEIAGAITSSDDSAQQLQQAIGTNRRPSGTTLKTKSSCQKDDDAPSFSGRVRIEPIDTRIRLHMKQTQVCAYPYR